MTSLQFVPLQTSSIHFTASNEHSEQPHEIIFYKSSKKALHTYGYWWIQVSTTKHISFDQYSKYDIKGYLFLEFKNEGLIKSGIQVDAKFKFNGYSSQSQPIYDSQGKTLPVQIDKLKSSYTVTFNGYSNQWNNDPKNIDVSVDLTLNSIQSIPPVHPVVANIHKKIEEHWIKSKRFFEMQDDDDFKDFTFNVGNQDFKIHKCVFAGKNEVLRTMFLSEFDESSKNSTKITDIIPEVFQVLVDFMYGNKEGFNGKVKNFVYAVYAAAHKYQIEDLQEFCVEYVTENLTDPNHAIETYSFAHFYDLKQLKDKCWSAIKNDIFEDETLNEPETEHFGSFFKDIQHLSEQLGKIKCQIRKQILNL